MSGEMIEKTKLCPWCQTNDDLVIRRYLQNPGDAHPDYLYAVVCQHCNASGPLALDADGAWGAWDRREDSHGVGETATVYSDGETTSLVWFDKAPPAEWDGMRVRVTLEEKQ